MGEGVSCWHLDTKPSSPPTLSLEGGWEGVTGKEGLNLTARNCYFSLPIGPKFPPYSLYEALQPQLVHDGISPTGNVWIYIRPGLL